MTTNWKSLARRSNALPEGWSTTEEIAADLDCEPQEVGKILASAIAAGTVEKRAFPHWQPSSRQLLYQNAYRQKPANAPAMPAPMAPVKSIGGNKRKPPYTHAELEAAVRSAASRHPGLTASGTRRNMPMRFRSATSSQVAEILGA